MIRFAIGAMGLLAFLVLLHLGQPILVPLLLALLLSQLLLPLVAILERRIPRFIAIVFGLCVVGIICAMIIGVISNQLALFQQDSPELQARLSAVAQRLQNFATIHLGIDPKGQIAYLQRGLESMLGAGGQFAVLALSLAVTTLSEALLIGIFVFLLLYYREHFRLWLTAVIAKKAGSKVEAIFARLEVVGQRYVAGLATVIVVVGILDTVSFILIKAPFPALFGLLGGLSVLIPYVGIFVVAPTCALLALAATGEPSMGLAVLAVYCVIHGLEGNVITPTLVGHQVNLNPLASLIAVLLGGAIWGPAGMLLFIPIVGMMVLALEVSPEGIPLARLLGNVPKPKNKTGAWSRLTRLKQQTRT